MVVQRDGAVVEFDSVLTASAFRWTDPDLDMPLSYTFYVFRYVSVALLDMQFRYTFHVQVCFVALFWWHRRFAADLLVL